MAAPQTLQRALASARERLVSAGIAPDEAAIDVDLYARTVLGWDRTRLLTEYPSPVPATLEPHFSELVERRSRHEPTAYIVGTREFWGLELVVSPAVLIPRPETELVVEEALALLRDVPEPRIADVGTGSGNIAVSLAVERPDAHVTATDLSPDALAVARLNAERHNVANRIEFVATAYLDGVAGRFDLIAANPPYVKSGDKPALARGVRHEPDLALFGGESGLRDIAGVLDTAGRALKDGGWMVMEFGLGQEDEVRALVDDRPALRLDHVRADLQGIARTAIIQHEGREG